MEYNWALAIILMSLLIIFSGSSTVEYFENGIENFTFELKLGGSKGSKPTPSKDSKEDSITKAYESNTDLAQDLRGSDLDIPQLPIDETPDDFWLPFRKLH